MTLWTAQAGALIVPTGLVLAQSPEVVLLANTLIDDSGSIESNKNTQYIIDGYNGALEDDYVNSTDQTRQVLMSTAFFTGGWLCQAVKPEDAPRLTRSNYHPVHSTPLFQASKAMLEFVSNAAAYLMARGFEVFSLTTIMTDGGQYPRTHQPSHVKPIADKLQLDSRHVVGGVAVHDGSTPFKEIFDRMGVSPDHRKLLGGMKKGDRSQRGRDIRRGAAQTMGAGARSQTDRRTWQEETSRLFSIDELNAGDEND